MINIRFWPDWRTANPYQQLFYSSLKPFGIIAKPGLEFYPSWLESEHKNIDLIHIHWPEGIWRRSGLIKLKESFHLLMLKNYLKKAKRLGIKVLWTIHNVADHEGVSIYDNIGYRILLNGCDLFIVHSNTISRGIKGRLNDDQLIISMQHGNYVGCYPKSNRKKDVLRNIGLGTDLPILACLGHLRNYKGFDIAIDAFKYLQGRAQLIIAGKPHESFNMEHLFSLAKGLENVRIIPTMLSNQEFSDLNCASDLILLPYREISGSGALFSAWTFGRCVVGSNLPYFREMAEIYPDALKLFQAGNAESLADVVLKYLSLSETRRSIAAIGARELSSWSTVITPVATALKHLTNH